MNDADLTCSLFELGQFERSSDLPSCVRLLRHVGRAEKIGGSTDSYPQFKASGGTDEDLMKILGLVHVSHACFPLRLC